MRGMGAQVPGGFPVAFGTALGAVRTAGTPVPSTGKGQVSSGREYSR
jgi:hypothetical protein